MTKAVFCVLQLNSSPYVVAVQQPKGDEDSDAEQQDMGESQDQYMVRRTKEFNIAVRTRPYELQLWLDYADFQDDLHK